MFCRGVAFMWMALWHQNPNTISEQVHRLVAAALLNPSGLRQQDSADPPHPKNCSEFGYKELK